MVLPILFLLNSPNGFRHDYVHNLGYKDWVNEGNVLTPKFEKRGPSPLTRQLQT